MENKEAEVHSFNIFMAGNIVLEYKKILESLAQQSALKLEAVLTHLLQKDVFVNHDFEIKQKRLTANNCDNYFRSWIAVNEHHDGFALVTVERRLSSCILDILCGGSGMHAPNNSKTEGPSSGERRSLLMLIKSLFQQVEDVFSAITPFKMMLTSKSSRRNS